MKPNNQALQNIMTRTSVRGYSEENVSEEHVTTLLEAAMAAPTAGNCQPWEFVVISNKELLGRISKVHSVMGMAAKAPIAITVVGVPTQAYPAANGYWIQDCSAATQNILLAAHAIGLGAVWCGVHPQTEKVIQISNLLNIPEGKVPFSVIVIGHLKKDKLPMCKWDPSKISFLQ